jgi:hypothetical protein
MHVFKILDEEGVRRIYAGKLLRTSATALTFNCHGVEMVVPLSRLLKIIPLANGDLEELRFPPAA